MRTTPQTAPEDLGTILSIWAHPDDETYLAAGLMAAARDNGQRVVCVTATAGELGTDDPSTWPADRLGAVRRWEAAAAMAVLGVAEHRVLGRPDGGLEPDDPTAIAQIGEIIDEVRPDTILTFGSDGMTFHSDHVAVHHWVTAAWAARGSRERLLYATSTTESLHLQREDVERWGAYMTDDRPEGVPAAELGVHLCLCGPGLDRKMVALRAMASQTEPAVAALGGDLYEALVREECFVEAVSTVAPSTQSRPAAGPPTIRPFRAEDGDGVVALSLDAWAPVFASFRSMLGEALYRRVHPDWRTDQAASVRDALERHETWVSTTDGAVSGFVNVVFDSENRAGEIYMIAVDPAFQRMGVASALTEHALREMRSRGIDLATVATGGDPGHAPARATYEKAGFIPGPQVWYAKLLT